MRLFITFLMVCNCLYVFSQETEHDEQGKIEYLKGQINRLEGEHQALNEQIQNLKCEVIKTQTIANENDKRFSSFQTEITIFLFIITLLGVLGAINAKENARVTAKDAINDYVKEFKTDLENLKGETKFLDESLTTLSESLDRIRKSKS